MSEINHCPICGSKVEDYGIMNEDRHIAVCPTHDAVEIVGRDIDLSIAGTESIKRQLGRPTDDGDA